MQDIVSGSGLRLGGNRQVELVALRGDEIEADIDLVLVSPLSRQTFPRFVTARYPVIPETDLERASGRGAMDEGLGEGGHGKGRRSDRGRSQHLAPGQPFRSHREAFPNRRDKAERAAAWRSNMHITKIWLTAPPPVPARTAGIATSRTRNPLCGGSGHRAAPRPCARFTARRCIIPVCSLRFPPRSEQSPDPSTRPGSRSARPACRSCPAWSCCLRY